jgi:putative transposase
MKPGAFTQLYVHLVFAVKNREAVLTESIRERVFEYIGGILNDLKHKPLIINGYTDHIHIFFGLNPTLSISDTVFHIKRGSSLFINEQKLCMGHFTWQEGYGAFTYSHSDIDRVFNYIKNQKAHHSKKKFREEYVSLLHEYSVNYDDRYLFDFFLTPSEEII